MPQTTEYLVLGIIVVALIMGLLVLSIFARYRGFQQDMRLLDELERHE